MNGNEKKRTKRRRRPGTRKRLIRLEHCEQRRLLATVTGSEFDDSTSSEQSSGNTAEVGSPVTGGNVNHLPSSGVVDQVFTFGEADGGRVTFENFSDRTSILVSVRKLAGCPILVYLGATWRGED